MTMRSQLLTIKCYTSYACTGQAYSTLSIDSEAATEITLAGLKQLFCFCSVATPVQVKQVTQRSDSAI